MFTKNSTCLKDLIDEAKKDIDKISDPNATYTAPAIKEAFGSCLMILERLINIVSQRELGGDIYDPEWGRFKSGKR